MVNGSADQAVVPAASVVLRVQHSSGLIPVAETTTDEMGRFEFAKLPLNEELVYVPGANLEGIHYPGHRVHLSAVQPSDNQRIVAYETVSDPCPLVVMRRDIEIEAQTGVLQVTETFVVSNPTLRSYVGTEGPDHEAR